MMASERPRRGRPGYDRQTVIRRSISVFTRHGYNGTSMDALARELGITKSAIYHHVSSKQDLLAQALSLGVDGLEDALARHEADTGVDAETRLRGAIRSAVEVFVDHHDSVSLLLRVRGNSEVERWALERRRAIDARMRGLVVAAIDEGALRSDLDPGLVTRLLFGMVNSLSEWYRPDHELSADDVAHAITTIAFDGLDKR